jgi:hypothetical protein
VTGVGAAASPEIHGKRLQLLKALGLTIPQRVLLQADDIITRSS